MKIGAYHIFSLLFVFSAVGVGVYTYVTANDLQEEVARNVAQKKALESEIDRLTAVRDGLAEGKSESSIDGDVSPTVTAEPTSDGAAVSTIVKETPAIKHCPPADDGKEVTTLREKLRDLDSRADEMETKGEAKFRELWRKFRACEEQHRTKDQTIADLKSKVAQLSKQESATKSSRRK